MTPETSRTITDLGTLKAFAHPLRLRLYRSLTVAGAATASQLAEQADEAVSLVSYHLRKLAAHGLIQEAEGRSTDSRERWWELAQRGVTFRDRDFSDAPERAAALGAAVRLLFRQRVEMYERYLDEQAAWGEEWRAAAISSESLLSLTAQELAALEQEMYAVVDKWQAHGRAAAEAGDTEGRESVTLHRYGFPFRP
ncbi:helix-turn-helix domain-containing protein [Streptomyces johnsoniae]|uniref:Helix-turn-helix domain-containing protein n=1 Tax=Streptomyces johnsoniae TaxID=3075532 RepID=A0ABU2S8C9_9ACTN|nr:helix-turn-helix domain-containing protein [Streptomyces sp. DSM 41886]MDT0445226.1 helix-turn-helix domain-containing protein [Streptomyces sp. DSM 41886]